MDEPTRQLDHLLTFSGNLSSGHQSFHYDQTTGDLTVHSQKQQETPVDAHNQLTGWEGTNLQGFLQGLSRCTFQQIF